MKLAFGRLLAFGLSWTLAACATSVGASPAVGDNPAEAPELRSLSFQGNHAFSGADLADGLATRPTSWIPFSKPSHFDAATFQGDLDRISTFYKANGYFDARVIRTEVTPSGPKAVRVQVIIDEGLPSKVRSLTLHGQEDLPADIQAALARPLALRVDRIFTQSAYQQSKDEILSRVHEFALAEAEVEGEAVVDPDSHAVDVSFTLSPGPHYRYSSFTIRGNKEVKTERIRREIDEVMKVGDDFQTSDLDEAQQHIFNLGVFSNAQVEAGEPDPDAGTIPVIASVVEAPFHTFRAGVGIGHDIAHDEVHVSGGYSDRDFLGGLRRLDFDNLVALEWLPGILDQAESAVPAFTSTLKLTQPEIFGHGIDLSGSVQIQRDAELGFGYWAVRGRLGLPWQISTHLTFTPSYNAEVLFFDTNSAFGGDLTSAALLSLSCQTCVLSYLEQTLTWDLRNDPLEPTFGFYAALDIQEAGGPLGGSFSNTRWLPEVRGYLPLTKRDVLAARFQIGALFTYDGAISPIDQRFFLGGIENVRGYGSQRLSPMVRVNTCAPIKNPKNPGQTLPSPLCQGPNQGLGILDIPVGGNGMIQASLELRHKLSKTFDVVAFVDSGEVTAEPFAFDFSSSTLAITPGLGLRVLTPIGALRIDLAFQATDPARPVALPCKPGQSGASCSLTFPQPGYQVPGQQQLSQGAVDPCGWPFFPTTTWNNYTQPSTCKSGFFDRLGLSFAIGEAF